MKDKRFFIKDSALVSTSSDFFAHEDFAQNIINILNTQTPPFSIAVIGKWGLGKSSLINFVEAHFKKIDTRYEFILINAWKYEKEALRKVFLKKIWEKLGGSEEGWLTTLIDALNNIVIAKKTKNKKRTVKERIKDFLSPIGKFLLTTLGFFALLVLITILWRFIGHGLTEGWAMPTFGSANGNTSVFSIYDATVKLFFSDTLIAVLISIGSTLILQFLNSYKKKVTENYNLVNPAKTTDDYESLLLEQLDKGENSEKIIVAIVDDLDRLAPEDIVEALDAIKSFSDIERCIFIVPFDEKKISEAVKESKSVQAQKDCYAVSELLLDKLFQFRVYLPGIIKRDLIPYAKDLCGSECPDLVSLCNAIEADCFVEELLPIMIHYNVETPRQVKKIINVFANNLLVLQRRMHNRRINVDLDVVLLCKLAKLSVLQADFSEFYDALYKQPSLISDFSIISETAESIDEADVSADSRDIFRALRESMTSFDFLLDFLNNFKHIPINENAIRTLIYISDSKAAMRTGGMEQKLAHALSVGNGKAAKQALESFDAPCDYLADELLEGQLSRRSENQYLVAIYEIFEDLKNANRERLADVISRRTEIALSSYSFSERSSIRIPDAIQVYLETADKKGVEKLLLLKISELMSSSSRNDSLISDSINAIFQHHSLLSESIVSAFNERVIANILKNESYTPTKFVECLEISIEDQIFKKFLSKEFVHSLVEGIADENITSGKVWDSFLVLWDLYVSNYGADSVPEMAYLLLKKFEYVLLLREKIMNIKDSIIANMALLIEALTQIEITDENSKHVLSLLEELDWEVYENISGDIDICLLALNRNSYINTLLKKLIAGKHFSLLQETLIAINTELLGSKNCYTEMVQDIAEHYNDEEKEDLIKKLDANLRPGIEVGLVSIAVSVFRRLKQLPDYADALFKIKNTLVPLFIANYARYPEWALLVVEVTGYKHNTDVPAFTQYLNSLNSIFASNMELSIKGWNFVNGTVDTTALRKMFELFLGIEFCDHVEHLENIYSIMSIWEKYVVDTDECAIQYEGLLIECIRQGINVESVLESLKKLDTLNDYSELFTASCLLVNDEKKAAAQVISTQIKANNNMLECVENLLSVDNSFDADLFHSVVREIFSNPVSECYLPILENINDNSSYALMINTLAVSVASLGSYKKGSILDLIKAIVRKDKKNSADDIVPILTKMPGYFISNIHRGELKVCLELMRPTTQTTASTIADTIELLGLNKKKPPKKQKEAFTNNASNEGVE